MEEYLHRKDLYTTLLMTLVKPGGIVSALGHREFQAPPPPRELPCAPLLRHAFLLAEAKNVQDYRRQILSTFGTVLKMDSTKKVSEDKHANVAKVKSFSFIVFTFSLVCCRW